MHLNMPAVITLYTSLLPSLDLYYAQFRHQLQNISVPFGSPRVRAILLALQMFDLNWNIGVRKIKEMQDTAAAISSSQLTASGNSRALHMV